MRLGTLDCGPLKHSSSDYPRKNQPNAIQCPINSARYDCSLKEWETERLELYVLGESDGPGIKINNGEEGMP